jgi:CBS domain-containing protein
MSATFAAPVASVLLAVELLLFEWKPRSMIPVALAAATAAAARRYIMGMGPLFPVTPHPAFIGPAGLAGCVAAGILAGALSGLLTLAVYAAEDSFAKLPIHWMWWPAIGGLVIGIGGLICPQALGVGYDIIGAELQGTIALKLMVLILIVKSIIWSVSLGSGTSGGVLAPLLMMGGALGGLESLILPNEGSGFWALVSMGAILGGTMRSPFTGVVFVLELTHDVNMLLPLLVAVTLAHGFTVLFLRRSILTEKVARRGFHLSREYAVDPLEILFAKEVMHPDVTVLPATASSDVLRTALQIDPKKGPQRLFPVVDESGRMVGVVTRVDLQRIVDGGNGSEELLKVIRATPTVAHPDEPLRVIVHRMAHTGLTRFPVIERGNGQHFLGLIALDDLLRARALNLEAERRRERLFKFETFLPFGRRTTV